MSWELEFGCLGFGQGGGLGFLGGGGLIFSIARIPVKSFNASFGLPILRSPVF